MGITKNKQTNAKIIAMTNSALPHTLLQSKL